MGETDWGGNWVLFWWAMLSKSLIQFSVDGWSCVPFLLFTWGQTTVEVMNPSKDPMHVLLYSLPPTLQQATTDPHLCWRFLDILGQVWVSLFCAHCSFLLGPGAHKVCLCPPRVYFLVQCKFWPLYGGVNGDLLQGGLCYSQVCCTQSPCPCDSPLLTCTIPPQGMPKHSSVSVSMGSLSPGAHKVCLNPLSISGGNGVWS